MASPYKRSGGVSYSSSTRSASPEPDGCFWACLKPFIKFCFICLLIGLVIAFIASIASQTNRSAYVPPPKPAYIPRAFVPDPIPPPTPRLEPSPPPPPSVPEVRKLELATQRLHPEIHASSSTFTLTATSATNAGNVNLTKIKAVLWLCAKPHSAGKIDGIDIGMGDVHSSLQAGYLFKDLSVKIPIDYAKAKNFHLENITPPCVLLTLQAIGGTEQTPQICYIINCNRFHFLAERWVKDPPNLSDYPSSLKLAWNRLTPLEREAVLQKHGKVKDASHLLSYQEMEAASQTAWSQFKNPFDKQMLLNRIEGQNIPITDADNSSTTFFKHSKEGL